MFNETIMNAELNEDSPLIPLYAAVRDSNLITEELDLDNGHFAVAGVGRVIIVSDVDNTGIISVEIMDANMTVVYGTMTFSGTAIGQAHAAIVEATA